MQAIDKICANGDIFIRLEPKNDFIGYINDAGNTQSWRDINFRDINFNDIRRIIFPEDETSVKCKDEENFIKEAVDQRVLKIVGSKCMFSQPVAVKTKPRKNIFKRKQDFREIGKTGTSNERGIAGTYKTCQASISKDARPVLLELGKQEGIECYTESRLLSPNDNPQQKGKCNTPQERYLDDISEKLRSGHSKPLKVAEVVNTKEQQHNKISKENGQISPLKDSSSLHSEVFNEINRAENFKERTEASRSKEREQCDISKYHSAVTERREVVKSKTGIQDSSFKERGVAKTYKDAMSGHSKAPKGSSVTFEERRHISISKGRSQVASSKNSRSILPKTDISTRKGKDSKSKRNVATSKTRTKRSTSKRKKSSKNDKKSFGKKETSISKERSKVSASKISSRSIPPKIDTRKGKSRKSKRKASTSKRKPKSSSKRIQTQKRKKTSKKVKKRSETKKTNISKRSSQVSTSKKLSRSIPPKTDTRKGKSSKSKGKDSTSKIKRKSSSKRKQTPKCKKSSKKVKESSGLKKPNISKGRSQVVASKNSIPTPLKTDTSSRKRKANKAKEKVTTFDRESQSCLKEEQTETHKNSSQNDKKSSEMKKTSISKIRSKIASSKKSGSIPPKKDEGKVGTSKIKSKSSSKGKQTPKRNKSSKKVKKSSVMKITSISKERSQVAVSKSLKPIPLKTETSSSKGKVSKSKGNISTSKRESCSKKEHLQKRKKSPKKDKKSSGTKKAKTITNKKLQSSSNKTGGCKKESLKRSLSFRKDIKFEI